MPDILTLAEAKTYLNKTASTDDTELAGFITAATELFEQLANRHWTATTQTERHNGGTNALLLDWSPVASITSVVDDGTTISSANYVFDSESGLVTFLDVWLGGRNKTVVVTYVTGVTPIPDLVKKGCGALLAHLWTSQRGAGPTRPQVGGNDSASTGPGFLVPDRVQTILDELEMANGIG